MNTTRISLSLVAGSLTLVAACAPASDKEGTPAAPPPVSAAASGAPRPPVTQDAPAPSGRQVRYSAYPSRTFADRVYFGDTHLHTSYSTDAGMIGNTLGPEEAYRFARGE